MEMDVWITVPKRYASRNFGRLQKAHVVLIFPSMKCFAWNSEKNESLVKERGISFERIIYLIENDGLLAVITHPNQDKYPNQRMFIVNVEAYAYLVLFIEGEKEIFLKTIIPSRKATKRYLEVNDEH